MAHEATPSHDLPALASKIGQMIRSNELKIAGKLLATARGHLYQLAEHDHTYHACYEHVAELRNELMEPGGEDFDEKKLLTLMLEEEKELKRLIAQRRLEPLVVSHSLLLAAAAIVLVYAQDVASGAPLEL